MAFGAIQTPGDGAPLVLMADRQPTGGYPKIANVIGADLSALAQMRAGDLLEFASVKLGGSGRGAAGAGAGDRCGRCAGAAVAQGIFAGVFAGAEPCRRGDRWAKDVDFHRYVNHPAYLYRPRPARCIDPTWVILDKMTERFPGVTSRP